MLRLRVVILLPSSLSSPSTITGDEMELVAVVDEEEEEVGGGQEEKEGEEADAEATMPFMSMASKARDAAFRCSEVEGGVADGTYSEAVSPAAAADALTPTAAAAVAEVEEEAAAEEEDEEEEEDDEADDNDAEEGGRGARAEVVK